MPMIFFPAMYGTVGSQPGVPHPPATAQPNPFGNAFYGASSGLIGGGLGAYGEKILGSSSEYVQSNVSRMSILEKIMLILALQKSRFLGKRGLLVTLVCNLT